MLILPLLSAPINTFNSLHNLIFNKLQFSISISSCFVILFPFFVTIKCILLIEDSIAISILSFES